jgi:hypothetical protein
MAPTSKRIALAAMIASTTAALFPAVATADDCQDGCVPEPIVELHLQLVDLVINPKSPLLPPNPVFPIEISRRLDLVILPPNPV